jgi:hypothetical protein
MGIRERAGLVDLAAHIEKSGRLKTLHEDGPSILDYARQLGTPDIVELLKKAGRRISGDRESQVDAGARSQ